MQDVFPIGYDAEVFASQALAIAHTYGFQLNQTILPRLQLTPKGLVLLIKGFSPLQVDFRMAKYDKQHALIRACKPKKGMQILDVTAGWGRDATILASAGAHITLIERQPVMAALLENGLTRINTNAQEKSHSSPFSLSLVHQDALHYLATLSAIHYPDVIYIDPMHPKRQKSALVKKDMQALQQLFGPDQDAKALIELALQRSPKVVVKWPQREKALITPQESIAGKTIRFDIYNTGLKCG
ncbi:MAG TPA: class I SAM-dependent methyltransferase [Legionellaceae bacterium]|nr:class I SAM-dependent methyltransferase [Legionellaceae bacterium]